jgi:hypothetical protein
MRRESLRSFAAAFAVSLACVGCNSGERTANQDVDTSAPATPAADARQPDEGSPMTLTGCLQRADGRNDFVLTQVNEQPGPVATSGSSETAAVERKQQEAASRTYRLSGGPENLADMVGHQVRVSGTVSDRGNVQPGSQNREIDTGDLATLEVASAESVSEACGNAGAKSGSGRQPRQ